MSAAHLSSTEATSYHESCYIYAFQRKFRNMEIKKEDRNKGKGKRKEQNWEKKKEEQYNPWTLKGVSFQLLNKNDVILPFSDM